MAPEGLGHYRILRVLGAGGMGEVYLAEDTTLHRNVAVKVLLPDAAADRERRERFTREARAVAALSHPNIVTIHSVEEDAGRLFLTMEYVDGKALTEIIPRDGMPLDKLLAIAIPLADAVAAAHQAGITHRDLKPANVMIASDGRIKVLDFGLAHLREEVVTQAAATMTAPLTGEGRILGTAAYMSPEQAEGRPIDSRSDLFSLGIVLFEMATGQRPFTGGTNLSIMSSILKDTPRPISSIRPDIPRELSRIIRRALQKDPEQRYQTAKDLRNDLQLLKAESDSGELAPAPSSGARVRRRSAARWLIVNAAVLTVAAVAGVAWWLFDGRGSARVPQAEWTAITDYADAAMEPALSPDGRMLAFMRGNGAFMADGDLYVKLLPTGTPVQLTHDSLKKANPRFSPDGTEIAYTALDDKFNFNTYVVPVFGGREPRLLLPNAAGLSWIGDHQYLFSEITYGFHMAVVIAGDGRADRREIYDPPTASGMAHYSEMSPDRQHVLISSEMDMSGMLPCRVVPADGHDRGVIVGPQNSKCFGGAWTRDGKWVILSIDTGSGMHLWRQRFPKGEPEQIALSPSEEAGVAVAPDGESVITSAGATHDSIWLHDKDGDHRVISEGSPGDLDFSPDGARLFFLDKRRAGQSSMEPGVVRAYDLEKRQVDTILGGAHVSGYSISHARKLIAYTRYTGREPHIWISPLDGSRPPRQLIADAAEAPTFGPDGLYYGKFAAGTFTPWRVDVDGSNPTAVGDFAGFIISIAPDGSSRVEWHFDSKESSAMRIYVRRLADGRRFPLACGICPAYWLDEHRFVILGQVVNMGGTSRTYVFPVSPGKLLPDGLEQMTNLDAFASQQRAKVLPGIAAMPTVGDGYAYVQHVAQRNLYRIPLR